MHARRFLRPLCAALLAVLLFGACTSARSQRQPPRSQGGEGRPNVLVVVTDDQPINSMAAMPKTVDWFRRGTHFTNFYVTTPQCCPSRSSILTGRYVHNTHVIDNSAALELDQRTTIERYLHDAGYETGLFGKFLNAWPAGRPPPYFDHFALTRHSARAYHDSYWNVDGDRRFVHEFDVDFIYSQAARFIDAADASQRSWFAYLAAAAPHAPFETEARNQGAAVPPWHGDPAVFERDRSDKPSYVRARHSSFAKGRKIRTEQLRSLMSVDDMLGRLHALLARKEALSDTLVILLSDNGLGWGQHGLTGKAVPYTFSIQVPMFMSWPGHIPSRSSDGRMAANIDITPTILDAAGLHPRLVAPLDGRSLLQEWRRKVVLTEFWNRRSGGVPQWASLRSKRWQYVEYYGPDGRSPRIREYYDLEHDPWQLHNLLGDRDPANDPSNVPELSRRLSAARGCSGSSCP